MSESRAPPGLRFGRGPNERRDTPDVLSRGTCLLVLDDKLLRRSALERGWVGVASSPATLPATLEAVEPTVRLRLRTVTVDGMLTEPRGDALGGVLTGPGSFERADCTRASRRCIWAVRVRMWVSELEGGILCDDAARAALAREVFVGAGVRRVLPVVATRLPRGRVVEDVNCLGFGVTLLSAEGRRGLRWVDIGVFAGGGRS